MVNSKKYEIKFPKGTDKAIVNKLAEICKDIVLNDASYAEVLGVYFAQPFYRRVHIRPELGSKNITA